jgi:hypothetical protein
MNLDLKYLGSSGLIEGATSSALSFQPNLARGKVFFDQSLKRPLHFREAISALHDVVVGDFRFQKRDKSVYEAWKAEQTRQEGELRAAVVDSEKRREMERIRGEQPPPNLQADFHRMHSLYWTARRQWATELMRNDPEMFRALVPCDPVVTVAPDTVFFECFAKDESSYGCLFVDRDAFSGSVSSGLGTLPVAAHVPRDAPAGGPHRLRGEGRERGLVPRREDRSAAELAEGLRAVERGDGAALTRGRAQRRHGVLAARAPASAPRKDRAAVDRVPPHSRQAGEPRAAAVGHEDREPRQAFCR